MIRTPERPLMIGLVGETAAGKTTLARRLDAMALAELDPRIERAYREIQTVRTRSMLQTAGYLGSVTDGPAMRAFHRDLRACDDSKRVFTQYYEHMGNDILIIDAVRHPIDAQTILDTGGFLMGLEMRDMTAGQRNLELISRFSGDLNTHGTPVDEKHHTETWEEAEREVHGDPNDPFASNIDATLAMVPGENRISANQTREGVFEDARNVVARISLQYAGVETPLQVLA